jgi:hypothetical protein
MSDTSGASEHLWACLPHPSPAHVVRLFTKDKQGKRFGDYARGPWEIDRFVKAHEGCDMYVAPNPTLCCTGVRHSSSDVTHWSYLFLDVDPIGEPSSPLQFLRETLLLLEDWTGKSITSPIIIDSGRGYQSWIRLPDWPITDNKCEIGISAKNARKVMGWWLTKLAARMGTRYNCRLDTSVSDLSRLMRLPGTTNTKTGFPARFIHSTQHVYDGLEYLLAAGVPKTLYDEPEVAPLAAGTPWQMVFTKLTLKAQNYLTKGQEDPGRHAVMWHAARKLQELGIDITQSRLALQYANSILGEEMALPPADIEHALKTAYSA